MSMLCLLPLSMPEIAKTASEFLDLGLPEFLNLLTWVLETEINFLRNNKSF